MWAFIKENLPLINNIILFFTFIVIAWYTRETRKLRIETAKQNEIALMPILMGYRDKLGNYYLKNIGHSPALNLEIGVFKIKEFTYQAVYERFIRQEGISKLEFHKKRNNSAVKYRVDNEFFDTNEVLLEAFYENVKNQKFKSSILLKGGSIIFKGVDKIS